MTSISRDIRLPVFKILSDSKNYFLVKRSLSKQLQRRLPEENRVIRKKVMRGQSFPFSG